MLGVKLVNVPTKFIAKAYFKLTFLEAMDVLFNPKNPEYGKAVQGEWFAWNCYLKLNESTNQVELWDFVEHSNSYSHYFSNGNIGVSKALLEQKFRTVSVLNKAGLAIEGINYFQRCEE